MLALINDRYAKTKMVTLSFNKKVDILSQWRFVLMKFNHYTKTSDFLRHVQLQYSYCFDITNTFPT